MQVHHLLDSDGHHHDAPGYSNPHIAPGDRILRVDDMQCENVSVETLHRMLSGVVHTQAKISLARISDGTSYTVTVLRHKYHEFDDKMIGGGEDCKQAEAVKGASVEEDWRLRDEAEKARRLEARRREEEAEHIAQEQRDEEEKNKFVEEESSKAEQERQLALAEKQRIKEERMMLEERERAAEVEILQAQLARKIKEEAKREDEAKISQELRERRKMEGESRKSEEAMHNATAERRKKAKEQAMAEEKKQREEEGERARMKEEAVRIQAEIVQLELERKEEAGRDRKSSQDRALQAMQEARNDQYHESELVLQQLNSRGEAGHDEVVMVSAKPKMQRSVTHKPEHAQRSAATRAIAVVQMSSSGSVAPSGADTEEMLREAGLARAAANEAKLAEYLVAFKAQEEQENLEKRDQEQQGLPQARVGLQGKAQSNVGSMPCLVECA